MCLASVLANRIVLGEALGMTGLPIGGRIVLKKMDAYWIIGLVI
jgi:hypothetical protein